MWQNLKIKSKNVYNAIMIQGIGIDIVDLIRFNDLAMNEQFRIQFFGEVESQLNVIRLAGRFAAREALSKATLPKEIFNWRDIEIINTSEGAPKFIFKGSAAKFFESKKIHLSISHLPEYAIAIVIIESV